MTALRAALGVVFDVLQGLLDVVVALAALRGAPWWRWVRLVAAPWAIAPSIQSWRLLAKPSK